MEVPEDRAGASLQCPLCRKLVDVPSLSDLQSLQEDGTFRIGEEEIRDEPDRLKELQRAFAPQRVDARGNDIDLRIRTDRPLAEDEVLEVLEDAKPTPPKYDPITGELIRDIPLRNEPVKVDPQTVPMAQAVINYASGVDIAEFNGWKIVPAMCNFQNMAVMGGVLVGHIIIQAMLLPILGGFFLLVPFFFFMCSLIAAHYGNVVSEIGTDVADELPRPLRNMSLYDDIWAPFTHFFIAAGLSYGWAFFAFQFPPELRLAWIGTVLIVGTLAFPALFLTTTTSGTVLNLAPHRLLRVVSTLGTAYLWCVIVWAIAGSVYVVGMGGSMLSVVGMFFQPGSQKWYEAPPFLVSYPLLFLGIFLTHAWCWYLGLLYRKHHDNFDWLLQRHERKIETIRPAKGFTAVRPQPGQTIVPPHRVQS
jgi:hypothetical protein